MPILIKSSNGQRTLKLVNNSTPKQSNTIDDIIEALKGLTFKFEVRIADIVQPDSDEPERVNNALASREEFVQPPEERLTVKQPIQPREKSVRSTIKEPLTATTPALPREDSVQSQKEPSATKTLPSAQPRVTFRSEQIVEPTPRLEEKPAVEVKANSQAEPKLAKVSEQLQGDKVETTPEVAQKVQPKLVRGDLKIGVIKTNCCVAVDETASPPIAYVAYDDSKLIELGDILERISTEGEIDNLPQLTTVTVGQIVLAKSNDDNKWYRSLVEDIKSDLIGVYFFDWGLRETLPVSRIRHLFYPDLGLSKIPACARKVRFTKTPAHMLADVLSCEKAFRMFVESYDDSTDCYEVTVMEIVEN